jgi:hypothetical protein
MLSIDGFKLQMRNGQQHAAATRIIHLLIRHCLSKNPFALSLSKCEWILVLRQAQHERQPISIRAGSIDAGRFSIWPASQSQQRGA